MPAREWARGDEEGDNTDMRKNLTLLVSAAAVLLFAATQAEGTEWDLGAKLGYESNVNRSLDSAKADTILTAYAAYDRSPSGESRVDWTFRAAVSGSAYASDNDLNQVTGSIIPGISVFLSPVWSLNVSPFLRGKAVSDSQQSAVSYGARATLSQRWSGKFYSGQYYNYTNSNANEDVYSYYENAIGILAGVNWTPSFFTEIGYEYAHGDTFVTTNSPVTAASIPGRGRGYRYGYSPAFNALVIKETVDRHSYGINAGYDFTKALFVSAGYTYTSESGDLGSVNNHSAVIGLGYRF